MGTLVPQPPPSHLDGKNLIPWYSGRVPPPHPWPWLCLHCHTVQPADRTDCRNCGAPKPTPEAQP